MISVLFSAYAEASNPFLWKNLDVIRELRTGGLPIEAFVGVTRSSDQTVDLLSARGENFLAGDFPNRADRYNGAFSRSRGAPDDWVVLVHPRSALDTAAYRSLEMLPPRFRWGAFTHEFDRDHPVLKFTSWYSNVVRGDLRRIFYLDHCLFIRRDLFAAINGVPSVDIFEDTLLSLRLARVSAPVRLPWKSTTSAIRFSTNGIFRQALLNQVLKAKFLLGNDLRRMNAEYERGLHLNGVTDGLPTSSAGELLPTEASTRAASRREETGNE